MVQTWREELLPRHVVKRRTSALMSRPSSLHQPGIGTAISIIHYRLGHNWPVKNTPYCYVIIVVEAAVVVTRHCRAVITRHYMR